MSIEVQNTTSEVPSVVGTIIIEFSVQCPHCSESLYQFKDREWFAKTIGRSVGRSFPNDVVNGEFLSECPECKEHFLIKGFCQ